MLYKEKLIFASDGNSNYRIPSINVTNDGTVIAFCNDRKNSLSDHAQEVTVALCRKALDGEWEKVETILGNKGFSCTIGTSVYDDETETMFLFASRIYAPTDEFKKYSEEELKNLKQKAIEITEEAGLFYGGVQLSSTDNGKTWVEMPLNVTETEYTHYDGRILKTKVNTHGASHGIKLRHGKHKGRLICPSRFTVDRYTDITGLITNGYNNAIYSDDHGKSWKSSKPVQIGTGEGTLIELEDGTILYNSRAYFQDGKRYLANSVDGGETYGDFRTDDFLIEEASMGCNASFLRVELDDITDKTLIPDGADGITLFCNPRASTRDNMSICVSFDSAKTWKLVKTVYPGHASYSSLCFNPVDQKFYLLYERGEETCVSDGVAVAEFDLEWLLSE